MKGRPKNHRDSLTKLQINDINKIGGFVASIKLPLVMAAEHSTSKLAVFAVMCGIHKINPTSVLDYSPAFSAFDVLKVIELMEMRMPCDWAKKRRARFGDRSIRPYLLMLLDEGWIKHWDRQMDKRVVFYSMTVKGKRACVRLFGERI